MGINIKNSNNVDRFHDSYINQPYGTRHMYLRTGTAPTATLKFGFSTDTSTNKVKTRLYNGNVSISSYTQTYLISRKTSTTLITGATYSLTSSYTVPIISTRSSTSYQNTNTHILVLGKTWTCTSNSQGTYVGTCGGGSYTYQTSTFGGNRRTYVSYYNKTETYIVNKTITRESYQSIATHKEYKTTTVVYQGKTTTHNSLVRTFTYKVGYSSWTQAQTNTSSYVQNNTRVGESYSTYPIYNTCTGYYNTYTYTYTANGVRTMTTHNFNI